MNLRDLKYLVAVYECKNFSRAAEKCFVSQPALSIQIKKLEKFLDVQLIERTNKSVMLTEVGEVLAQHAKGILQRAEEIREIARAAKDPYSGELRLAIIPTLAAYLLPAIMPKIKKQFPKLTVLLLEEKTNIILEKLAEGKIDAAILALPIDNPAFTAVEIFQEEFLLAVAKNHKLAKQKDFCLKDLNKEKLLLLEEGHCFREQVLTFCKKIKSAEYQDFSATSLETLRQMVIAGVGVTLMPKLACKKSSDICYLSFATPKPTRSIAIVWRSSAKAKLPLLKQLALLMKN